MPEGKAGPLEVIYYAITYAPYALLAFFVLLAIVMAISIVINRLKK